MEILDIILLELELDQPTALLELDIARVIQQVKNYCNIEEIPQELNYTVADIVVGLQRERTGDCINFTNTDMGDTSYSFDVDNSIDGILKDHRTDLTRFRKLRW